jgi:hypothetical protein
MGGVVTLLAVDMMASGFNTVIAVDRFTTVVAMNSQRD